MKGITFGELHSYRDLNLVLSTKEIGAPSVKEKKVEIEGADGSIDYTDFFDGPKYGDVKHKFTFSSIVPRSEFLTHYSTVKNAIHGKKLRIILDDDPGFFYVGRCTVGSFTDENGVGKITVECDCEPYKYKLQKTVVSYAVDGVEVISRKSSSFMHTVVFSFGSYSKSYTGVGTSQAYAIPTSWLNAIPNATSGTAKVTVTTYSGSTKIGSAVSKNFTLTVPASVVPTISGVTIAETVSGLNAQFGGFVQSKSKAKVTITAAGALSSTIKAYKTVVDGKTYTGSAPTTGTLNTSGSRTITISVTDSRGRTASTTRTIDVIAYAAPKISTFTALRANAAGDADENGTRAQARINFSVSSVNSKNSKIYLLEYRKKGTEQWTRAATGSVYSYNSSMLLTDTIDTDASYDLRLSVSDYFGTVTANTEIATAFTLMDFNASGKGVAFGKVSELSNGLEVDMDASFYRNIYMGGAKRSDDEKNMYIQSSESAANVHNCKLYGGNGGSVTSIGCWDTLRSHGIWRYLTGTQNMVIDRNVSLTHGNGGDHFVTSGDVTHGSRTGRVLFSNGLLIQWGTESITPVANTPTKKAVIFAVSYTDTPIVITTAQTAVPGTSVTGNSAASITETGFDCYVTRTGTTATSVGWLAIGYKAP